MSYLNEPIITHRIYPRFLLIGYRGLTKLVIDNENYVNITKIFKVSKSKRNVVHTWLTDHRYQINTLHTTHSVYPIRVVRNYDMSVRGTYVHPLLLQYVFSSIATRKSLMFSSLWNIYLQDHSTQFNTTEPKITSTPTYNVELDSIHVDDDLIVDNKETHNVVESIVVEETTGLTAHNIVYKTNKLSRPYPTTYRGDRVIKVEIKHFMDNTCNEATIEHVECNQSD